MTVKFGTCFPNGGYTAGDYDRLARSAKSLGMTLPRVEVNFPVACPRNGTKTRSYWDGLLSGGRPGVGHRLDRGRRASTPSTTLAWSR